MTMKQDVLYSNLRKESLQIAQSAISSVSSYKLVSQALTSAISAVNASDACSNSDQKLQIGSMDPNVPAIHLLVNGQNYTIRHNLYVIAFGKCVLGMVRAVQEILGPHIVRGIAIIPTGTLSRLRATGKKCDLNIHVVFFYI